MSLAPLFSATGVVSGGYRSGDCPECGGIDIPLVGRELAPHRPFVRRGSIQVEMDPVDRHGKEVDPCDGSGGPTAEDLEARPRKRRSTGRKPGRPKRTATPSDEQ